MFITKLTGTPSQRKSAVQAKIKSATTRMPKYMSPKNLATGNFGPAGLVKAGAATGARVAGRLGARAMKMAKPLVKKTGNKLAAMYAKKYGSKL